MQDDAQLIDQALAGNADAFGTLVRKYQDRLYNFLVHLLGCPEEAEDVAQDTFVRAFLKLQTYRGASAFYTWLYRIAYNTAISRMRRKRPEVSMTRQGRPGANEPVDRGMGPNDRLQSQERAQQVQTALAALSDEHRAILVLRDVDGRRYDTIAQVLDLSLGTVRSRLHRARRRLREQLKEVLPEYPR